MNGLSTFRRCIVMLGVVGVALLMACAPPAAPAPTAKPAAEQKPAAQAAPATSAPSVSAKPAEKVAAPPTAAPAAAAKPAGPPAGVKQELVISEGIDPQNLDPHILDQQPTRNITQTINEPLIDWDYDKQALYGVLATDWKLVNPTTWQFKLRGDVKFSNGEPFNAEVVKYNIERVRNPETKSGYLVQLVDLDRVEVVDPMTVNFVTKAPWPALPINLSRIGMLPQKFATETSMADVAKAPIGTGPYRVVEYIRDERVVLEPNAEYWGQKPYLTKVTFRPVPEASSRVAALQTGRSDIVTIVPIGDVPNLKSDQNLDVIGQPGMRGMILQINTLKFDTPLKDKRVRQALNYAVDKDAIIQSVVGGYGEKLRGSVVVPGYFGYSPRLEPYPYDLAKAKALLAEAGVPDGFELSLTTTQGRYMADKEIAEAVAGQLTKAGVSTKVVVKDRSVITQEIGDHTLGPLAYLGFSSTPDATTLLSLQETGNRNSQSSIPEFDPLIVQARRELDDTKRADLLLQAQQILREEAYVVFLHQQFDLYAFNKKVENFKPMPNERIDFTRVWIGK